MARTRLKERDGEPVEQAVGQRLRPRHALTRFKPALLRDEAGFEHPAMDDLPLIGAAAEGEKFRSFAPQRLEFADPRIGPAIGDGRQAFAHFLNDESAGFVLSHRAMIIIRDAR